MALFHKFCTQVDHFLKNFTPIRVGFSLFLCTHTHSPPNAVGAHQYLFGGKVQPLHPPPWGIKHLARVGPYSEVHCTSEATPVVSNMRTGFSPFWVSADVPLERPCYRENCTHKDGIFQALEAPISIGFSRFCTHKGRGCLTFFFQKSEMKTYN